MLSHHAGHPYTSYYQSPAETRIAAPPHDIYQDSYIGDIPPDDDDYHDYPAQEFYHPQTWHEPSFVDDSFYPQEQQRQVEIRYVPIGFETGYDQDRPTVPLERHRRPKTGKGIFLFFGWFC